MASYWVADTQSRVLGPMSLDVLRDLAKAGKVHSLTQISRDGKAWLPLAEVPEVAELFGSVSAPKQIKQWQEAEQIRLKLDTFRELPAHKVFGVPENASLEAYQAAYRKMARVYFPGLLPKDTHPSLVAATTEMFQFLGQRMGLVEKHKAAPPTQES